MVFLESVDIGDNDRFIVEKCPRCFGLFFDNHEFEALLEKSTGNSYWINHKKLHSLLQHPLHKDIVQYRKCPECSSVMHRKNYMNRSGVIMDVCIKHGVWLDAGELKQIQEWTALGGKQHAKEAIETQRYTKSSPSKSQSNHYEEKIENSTAMDAALNILEDLLRWH
jgi:Zn-finger nucleic acid-binding protein